MPIYAILGATGNVGQALLKVLLQSPSNTIHAYCRSKQKLLKLSPEVNDSKQVQIFEGNLSDKDLLANCLSGTRAAFLAVAATANEPGCTIAQDTAHAVISALEQLQSRKERLPKLVVLSSASTDHDLMTNVSKILRDTLYCACSNIYDDLKLAEKLLRSKESLVSTTFIKPGALSNDAQKGHVLNTETAYSPISFLDLAAGMVETADDEGGRYDMKGVAVNAVAKDVAFPREAPFALFWGLFFHFFPWAYRYLG